MHVILRGDAAAQAQHLVAELLDSDIEIQPPHDAGPEDRGFETVIVDVIIGIATNASYDAVSSLVKRWLAKRNLPSDAGRVEDDDDDDDGRASSDSD